MNFDALNDPANFEPDSEPQLPQSQQQDDLPSEKNEEFKDSQGNKEEVQSKLPDFNDPKSFFSMVQNIVSEAESDKDFMTAMQSFAVQNNGQMPLNLEELPEDLRKSFESFASKVMDTSAQTDQTKSDENPKVVEPNEVKSSEEQSVVQGPKVTSLRKPLEFSDEQLTPNQLSDLRAELIALLNFDDQAKKHNEEEAQKQQKAQTPQMPQLPKDMEHFIKDLLGDQNTNALFINPFQMQNPEALEGSPLSMLFPQGGQNSNDATQKADAKTKDSTQTTETGRKKFKFLDNYGRNLNDLAIQGKLDRLIGREQEINRVLQILNRRNKNNPVLLGEPGVGKTAIAEGLADRIVRGLVPAKLQGFQVYLLDMTAMVAGTQFRGQFESRMKSVVDEARTAENIILVIDELHNIMGAGDAEGAMNAANILKPSLARGEIRVLGSTTNEEYRRFIEEDSALERRFQPIQIDEPNEAVCLDILRGCRDYYEKHHHVHYTDDALKACVTLSTRYIQERFLPDKAIDLMDEAGSLANLNNKKLVSLKHLEDEKKKLREELAILEEKGPIAGYENEFYAVQAGSKAELLRIQEELMRLKLQLRPTEIGVTQIAEIVEKWTGIPVKALSEAESDRLLRMEERIHERVIGQDEAIHSIAKAIRRKRAGLEAIQKPASFILVGPTGVGKTSVVKAVAEALFGEEDAYIRLDMSEYMESHSSSKLIGSPPGYVGYDDAGHLSERVRKKPYSVVLFDEIEKAHPDIFNILLQILDEGRLTDSHGRKVNFSNTVIMMTSNAGSHHTASSAFGFGKSETEANKERVQKALKEIFRPEFLNRIDEVLIFDALTEEEMQDICKLMIKQLQDHLAKRRIQLLIDDEVIAYLSKEAYDPQYGARPLRRKIQKDVEDALADYLLRHGLTDGDKISIRLKPNYKDQDQALDFICEKQGAKHFFGMF